MIIRSDHLEYTVGTSDKLYNLALTDHGANNTRYEIVAEYGRRGAVLQSVSKGLFTWRTEADEFYDKILLEKERKGYTGVRVQTVRTPKRNKTQKKKAIQLEQNAEEGVRRIDFEL